MKRKGQKEHAQHSGSVDQRERTTTSGGRDVSQGVTTNPRDVGEGGGSAPLGRHGKDSVSWKDAEGQPNQRKSEANSEGPKESRSKDADAGAADEQEGDDEDGTKQGSSHQDPLATLPAGAPHGKRSTM